MSRFGRRLQMIAQVDAAAPIVSVPGWLRTASNTGLAAKGVTSGDLTSFGTISSDITVTSHQYRKRFNMGTHQMILTGPNAWLEECEINTSHVNGHGSIQLEGAGGQRMTHCDVIGGSTSSAGEAIGIKSWAEAQNVEITSVRMTGVTIFIWLDSDQTNANPSVITDFYGYNQIPETGLQQHRDGFTRRQGSAPLTITNSRFACDQDFTTGAWFIQPTSGVVGRVSSSQNYFEGKGFCVTIESSHNLLFDDNRIRSTQFGPVSKSGTVTNFSWTNNYVYVNNGTDYRGALIANP